MTVVYYLIVCVNLLISFVQAETFSASLARKIRKDELEFLVKTITVENQYEYLAKMLTPYWNLAYGDELNKKQNRCKDNVNMIVKLSKSLKNLISYRLFQIVPSPVTEAYRSNDEFYVKRGVDGKPKTVGCLFGSPKRGRLVSIHPTQTVTIKESHKRVAQVYEDFIRLSNVGTSAKLYSGGHWNTLFVRSNEAGEVMATVSVRPKGFTYNTMHRQKYLLKGYFLKHLPSITLYHQQCQTIRCTHDVAPFYLLYGKRYLMETLNGFQFKIFPHSIFPTNKLGAEVMYDIIIRRARLKPNTTVLDICSNTAINSIILSKFVREAVRFAILPEEHSGAKYFAESNNIHNVKFLLGTVDKNLNSVLESLNVSSDVVVILSNRITLLGLDVINTIRRSSQISRLVYISIRPDSPKGIETIVHLCSNDNSTVPPFRLTNVIPIDMLPKTLYVELISFFQR